MTSRRLFYWVSELNTEQGILENWRVIHAAEVFPRGKVPKAIFKDNISSVNVICRIASYDMLLQTLDSRSQCEFQITALAQLHRLLSKDLEQNSHCYVPSTSARTKARHKLINTKLLSNRNPINILIVYFCIFYERHWLSNGLLCFCSDKISVSLCGISWSSSVQKYKDMLINFGL